MSLDEELRNEILRAIELQGAVHEENALIHVILGSRNNLNHIMNMHAGLPKLRNDVINRFQLILSTPTELKPLSQFEVRCVLCRRVISYPAWYYVLRYVVNQLHYFICFDAASPDKPSVKCFKR